MSTAAISEHVVPAAAAGRRLHDHLKDRLVCVPVTELGDLVKAGVVTVDGARVPTDLRLRGGEVVGFAREAEAELVASGRWMPAWEREIAIAHEDDDLLVVSKPAGMHVHPLGAYRDETLLNALLWKAGARPGNPWGRYRPVPAHRLDRPTGGLVIVAKRAEVRDAVRRAIDAGEVRRSYVALVEGTPREDAGVIRSPIGVDPEDGYRRATVSVADGGQEAVTRWRVRERREKTAVIECELETGRTHQIRVHLASIGLPIVGDELYGGSPGDSSVISLHAWRIEYGAIVCVDSAPFLL